MQSLKPGVFAAYAFILVVSTAVYTTVSRSMPSLLGPVAARIIESPFPPPSALPALKDLVDKRRSAHELAALLPRKTHSQEDKDMGWSTTDSVYWNHIPAEAKLIPRDWAAIKPVRYVNGQLGGTREIRFHAANRFDQWLLSDPFHELNACISIERQTKRIYFMEVQRRKDGSWGYQPAFDNCYSCHPSGLRVIRPLDPIGVNRSLLAEFNRRILAYGPADFGGDIDVRARGETISSLSAAGIMGSVSPIDAAKCETCHNGEIRARLYEIHLPMAEFKTQSEQTMPPAIESDRKGG